MSPHQRTEKTQTFNGTCADASRMNETFPVHTSCREKLQYLLAKISHTKQMNLKDFSQINARLGYTERVASGLKARFLRALTGRACEHAHISTSKRRSATYGRAAFDVQDGRQRAMHAP